MKAVNDHPQVGVVSFLDDPPSVVEGSYVRPRRAPHSQLSTDAMRRAQPTDAAALPPDRRRRLTLVPVFEQTSIIGAPSPCMTSNFLSTLSRLRASYSPETPSKSRNG